MASRCTAGSDILIEGNTIENSHEQTSAINIANDFGSIDNVIVRNNSLSGGGYTIYVRGNQPLNAGPVTNIVIENNRLVEGYYGYASIEEAQVWTAGNLNDLGALIGF